MLVKVVGNSTGDPGSIPGSSRAEIEKNSILKTWNLNAILKRTYSTASFRRFGVFAKAM